jgi:hypothetical protein
MSYYDKLVQDPGGAFDEIARRRQLSPQELEQRLAHMLEGAASGEHLTLGEAQQYFDEGSPPAERLVEHVDACGYCKSLVEALSPSAVDEAFNRVLTQIDSARQTRAVSGKPVTPKNRIKASYLEFGFAIAATVLVTLAVVPNSVAPWFKGQRENVTTARQEIDFLNAQLAESRRVVEAYAGRQASMHMTVPVSYGASPEELTMARLVQPVAWPKSKWVVEEKAQNAAGQIELTLRQLEIPKVTGAALAPSERTKSAAQLDEGDSVFILAPSNFAVVDPADAPWLEPVAPPQH